MTTPSKLCQSVTGLLAVFISISVFAAQPEITSPGITWGEIRYPSDTAPSERDNLIIEGAIEQGINFSRPGSRNSVTVFGKLNYAADTQELEFNNKLKLGVGIKLRHTFADDGIAHIGIKYEYDNRFTSGRELHGSMLFADVYKGWTFRGSAVQGHTSGFPAAYPGLTWAELRYPGSQDPSEEDDLIFEGAVEQGIDWFEVRGVVFNTFAEAQYVVDSKKLDWNNELTLGGGVKLKFSLNDRISAQIGVKYNHDRGWKSGRSEQDIIWFISWSDTWVSPL